MLAMSISQLELLENARHRMGSCRTFAYRLRAAGHLDLNNQEIDEFIFAAFGLDADLLRKEYYASIIRRRKEARTDAEMAADKLKTYKRRESQKKRTKRRNDWVIKLHQEGMGVQDLAIKFKRSTTTIRNILG